MMDPEHIEKALERMHRTNGSSCFEIEDEIVPEHLFHERTYQERPMGSIHDVYDELFPEPVLNHFTKILRLETENMTSAKKTKTDFITSLVKKEIKDENLNIDQEKKPSQSQDEGCSSDCKIKEISVDYCESLHSLSPTEMNIHVKGFVPCRKSRGNNFSLQKGSLEQAFLGNIEKKRLIFQVINLEIDQEINCIKVELTDGGEYSGNCIFSEELTRVEKYVNLWSIIEVLEYDIIADKFIQIRRFKVLKNMTSMIGDPDPDPIEDCLFLKIHKGDYPISSCRHNQVHRNQMAETLVRSSSDFLHDSFTKLDLTSPGTLKKKLKESSPVSLKGWFQDCSPETLKGRLKDLARLKDCRLDKLRKVTGQYKENMAELHLLQAGCNITDKPLYPPIQQFVSFLKSNNAPSRVVSEIQADVMRVSAMATPTPTISPASQPWVSIANLPGAMPTVSPGRQTWRGFSSTQPVFLL